MTNNAPIAYRAAPGTVFKLTLSPAAGSGNRFTCFAKVEKPGGARELWRSSQLLVGQTLTLAAGDYDIDAVVAFDANAPASETCSLSAEFRAPGGAINTVQRSMSNNPAAGDWVTISITV